MLYVCAATHMWAGVACVQVGGWSLRRGCACGAPCCSLYNTDVKTPRLQPCSWPLMEGSGDRLHTSGACCVRAPRACASSRGMPAAAAQRRRRHSQAAPHGVVDPKGVARVFAEHYAAVGNPSLFARGAGFVEAHERAIRRGIPGLVAQSRLNPAVQELDGPITRREVEQTLLALPNRIG
ncbi:MAG: hypothetical protein J3K34DRAFT_168348 [Monoraphidium minutum]|nr:MAG: hypothetical protein J3K34DRAFT_168348 [Monoraphidium minutum]